ncbi:toll/interleukin-1 receptor domain-containing protein [Pseudogemmobacter blasticus]|uniref:TIR domain protein n=1 Tax=Fuscovulum blasticum DSM 2131 TaxID=1188250 RepID=A0A2T4J8G8_FUSBL|nr:toll/interleukin-1 receptor domain-containing protein [Fuscovulum blasticum]PTE14192.1 TIR domain protein [Fuscovulum blasticum DSM 2131]
MARCTAPIKGHRSAAAAADCPVCGSRYGRRSYAGGYGSYSYSTAYSAPSVSSTVRSGGSGAARTKPKWSPASSTVYYSEAEVRALTPIRRSVEVRPPQNDPKDVFLCHAWDDRGSAAKDLHDLLEARGVSVWFSEKDVLLGSPLLREIDKGLARSRVGIVLVTPAFLKRIQGQGVSDKELSALLARDLLVPIVHGTTYEALREISPLLASRTGLSTAADTMAEIANKLAELIAV